jgi:hypothetical protein
MQTLLELSLDHCHIADVGSAQVTPGAGRPAPGCARSLSPNAIIADYPHVREKPCKLEHGS